jgi:hypothetical protein
MERLCEDELMCIKKYVPDAQMPISEERLYNEIKLLDPTFSMVKLYYDLVRWRTLMKEMKGEKIYPLYEVLREHSIEDICEHDATHCIAIEGEDSAESIRDALITRGYIVSYVYGGICIERLYVHDLQERLAAIEHATLSHPIRNIQFRQCRRLSPHRYEYRVSHRVRDDDMYVPDRTYDHELYRAIRSIDPTIDMNMLYSIYAHKYARENAVRDMYRLWYPYLGSISVLKVIPEEHKMSIRSLSGPLYRPPGRIAGWDYDSDTGRYYGLDTHDMYDKFLTMLRMYYSYSLPRIDYMGIDYYDA